MSTDVRQAFEEWATREGFNIDRDDTEKYRDYHRATTRWAWNAWTASRSQALEEAAQIAQSEALEDPHGREDAAYGLAVEHVVAAIRRLSGQQEGK